MMDELAHARESQMRSKLKLQADMAEVEKKEFTRVLEVNQQKEYEDTCQVRRCYCWS